jgi:hypothetical protein
MFIVVYFTDEDYDGCSVRKDLYGMTFRHSGLGGGGNSCIKSRTDSAAIFVPCLSDRNG